MTDQISQSEQSEQPSGEVGGADEPAATTNAESEVEVAAPASPTSEPKPAGRMPERDPDAVTADPHSDPQLPPHPASLEEVDSPIDVDAFDGTDEPQDEDEDETVEHSDDLYEAAGMVDGDPSGTADHTVYETDDQNIISRESSVPLDDPVDLSDAVGSDQDEDQSEAADTLPNEHDDPSEPNHADDSNEDYHTEDDKFGADSNGEESDAPPSSDDAALLQPEESQQEANIPQPASNQTDKLAEQSALPTNENLPAEESLPIDNPPSASNAPTASMLPEPAAELQSQEAQPEPSTEFPDADPIEVQSQQQPEPEPEPELATSLTDSEPIDVQPQHPEPEPPISLPDSQLIEFQPQQQLESEPTVCLPNLKQSTGQNEQQIDPEVSPSPPDSEPTTPTPPTELVTETPASAESAVNTANDMVDIAMPQPISLTCDSTTTTKLQLPAAPETPVDVTMADAADNDDSTSAVPKETPIETPQELVVDPETPTESPLTGTDIVPTDTANADSVATAGVDGSGYEDGAVHIVDTGKEEGDAISLESSEVQDEALATPVAEDGDGDATMGDTGDDAVSVVSKPGPDGEPKEAASALPVTEATVAKDESTAPLSVAPAELPEIEPSVQIAIVTESQMDVGAKPEVDTPKATVEPDSDDKPSMDPTNSLVPEQSTPGSDEPKSAPGTISEQKQIPTAAEGNAQTPPRENLTAPLFGILPVKKSDRQQPVSFSSPHTFFKASLNATAPSFTPSALRQKEPKEQTGSQLVILKGGKLSATDPAAADPAKPVKRVTFSDKNEEFTITPVNLSPAPELLPSVSIVEDSGPVPQKLELFSTTASPDMDDIITSKPDTSTLTNEGEPSKPVAPEADTHGIFESVLNDGSRCVELTNVAMSVKNAGSKKVMKRGPLSRLRLTIRSGKNSTLQFLKGNEADAEVWETMTPSEESIRVRKIRNPPYVMLLLVEGPADAEDGRRTNNGRRFYIQLERNSFEKLFPLCTQYVSEDHTSKMPPKLGSASALGKRRQESAARVARSPAIESPETKDGNVDAPKAPSEKKSATSKAAASKAVVASKARPKSISPATTSTPSALNLGSKLDKKNNVKGSKLSKKRASSSEGDSDSDVSGKRARLDDSGDEREELKRRNAALLKDKRKKLLAGLRKPAKILHGGPKGSGPEKENVEDSLMKAAKKQGAAAKVEATASKTGGLVQAGTPRSIASASGNLNMASMVVKSSDGDVEMPDGSEQGEKSLASVREAGARSGRKGGKKQSLTGRRGGGGGSGVELGVQKSILKTVKMKKLPDESVAAIIVDGGERDALTEVSSVVKPLVESEVSLRIKEIELKMAREMDERVGKAVGDMRSSYDVQQTKLMETAVKGVLNEVFGPWKARGVKVKERKEKEEGSLTCFRPESAGDFFARLHTFKPSTWVEFGSKSVIDPVECALRGWHNSGKDRLRSSDGSEVVARRKDLLSIGSRAEEVLRLRGLIDGKGHKLLSGWIGQCCEDGFRKAKESGRVYDGEGLRQNAESLQKADVVNVIPELNESGSGIGLSDLDGKECMRLAVCNWNVEGEVYRDLFCQWCDRRFCIAPKSVFVETDMEFDLTKSHFTFCPFREADGVRVNMDSLGQKAGDFDSGTGMGGDEAIDVGVKDGDVIMS